MEIETSSHTTEAMASVDEVVCWAAAHVRLRRKDPVLGTYHWRIERFIFTRGRDWPAIRSRWQVDYLLADEWLSIVRSG